MPYRMIDDALTFDDVLLVPAYSTILPKDTDISTQLTRRIRLNIPLLSAAMDTVTEARLAIALAQEGGMGFIHKNMSIAQQAEAVRTVKKYESGVVRDPVTIAPDLSVRDLLAIAQHHGFSGMPVVKGRDLVGIVTSRDLRFETNLDLPISAIMTPKERLVTIKDGASREEVMALLHQHRLEKLLVVNDQFQLCGMITARDILKAKEKPFAAKDEQERLRVGAAVGTASGTYERVEALIDAGVDVLVVDTAHGHSRGVLETVKWIKDHAAGIDVIGGNIATGDAARALLDQGADAVKVGIGPGSICTTRVITGVGVPQIAAIQSVAEALKDTDVPVIADGGIRFSGDICKAIAAGADAVMIGGLFAGTEESPGEIELYQNKTYKTYRGMGSLGAMAAGSSDRYFQDKSQGMEKLVPEGIEGRVPYKGPMQNIVHQLIGGLRSCMGYTGSANLAALKKAQFVRISQAGILESHVHDVSITKQAPNYQVD